MGYCFTHTHTHAFVFVSLSHLDSHPDGLRSLPREHKDCRGLDAVECGVRRTEDARARPHAAHRRSGAVGVRGGGEGEEREAQHG